MTHTTRTLVMPKILSDILDSMEDDELSDDAKLIEDIKYSRPESFDDHQQWMIDSFKDLQR